MSLTWAERKDILASLLQTHADDDEGLALDRILHGQNAIGKTCAFNSDWAYGVTLLNQRM
ncbi:hypothetical protein HYDPIDRAFT_94640 [Hydnomerulius pinastri MD-312]|uniref:Uncharacterized protein n=1 Tax=Hydnomerulius pinastri MD-312 TaxID=994086 RepID=A0A0C9V9F1_9AGAM|nr:hypothetical protein HYDPIDRAFT_94640 [Hydnomerulius pinastri MD-312]